jgi:hypothetical protein
MIAIIPNASGNNKRVRIRLPPNRNAWLTPYPTKVHELDCITRCLREGAFLGIISFNNQVLDRIERVNSKPLLIGKKTFAVNKTG